MTQQEIQAHLKDKLVALYNYLNNIDVKYVKAQSQVLNARDMTLEAIHISELRSDE